MSLEMRTLTATPPIVQPEQALLLIMPGICQEVSAVSPSQTKTAPCVMKCANLASESHRSPKAKLSVIQLTARAAAKTPAFNPRTSLNQMMVAPASLKKTAPCAMKCVILASASLRSLTTRLSAIHRVASIAVTALDFKPRTRTKQTITRTEKLLAVSLPDPPYPPTDLATIIVLDVYPIQENHGVLLR